MKAKKNNKNHHYDQLSPFELKDELIRFASEATGKSQRTMLNAGRGNPNWVATTPREALFTLGQFALQESKRVWDEPDLGGMPSQSGIAQRLVQFLGRSDSTPGVKLLNSILDFAKKEFEFNLDAFVYELVDSVIGDNYPVPDRMLKHTEEVVHRFLVKEMCDDKPPEGRFDLFATEGGTAAMCYVFNSLVENGILKKGDTIALGTPIFTPYLEIPKLNNFEFKTIDINQSEMVNGRHIWQYPESEIRKLEDPNIKAFFVVNPGNPGSSAMRQETVDQIVEIVKTKNPNLLLLTDDVYGTFVPGFRSLAADLPRNTILVYSYSKHFGCTGWRLGAIAIHEDNVIDQMLKAHPQHEKNALAHRYGSLSLNVEKLKFIDRIVADSRDVALNHTSGASLIQQAQMVLFSMFAMLDSGKAYKKRCREIVLNRMRILFKSLGVPLDESQLRTYYYVTLDLEAYAKKMLGEDFFAYVEAHRDPLDILFALAKRHGIVLLNGSGFDGPPWSVRVSLANLDDAAYEKIGEGLVELIEGAVEKWKLSKEKVA